ncbi:MAG: hypothetical protein ABIQ04_00990 [Candidatus Saccharimonadales bacterium]
MFSKIRPTEQEVARPLPGDEIVENADVIMDRAFTLAGSPEEVWKWFMQLGKNRSGWYFPRSVEYFILPKKRALRTIDPRLQNLRVGTVIDDWGGRHATFEVAVLDPPFTLVHISKRGNTYLSWAIILEPAKDGSTRVQLRLRISPVRQKWLVVSVGGLADILTVAGLAAGLRERLS